MTAPDKQWMREFTQQLMQQHLCAAAHTYPFDTAYHWQGEVHEKTEIRAVLYTRASLVERISQLTRQQHPYEVPHVTATPLVAGNPDYLQWIFDETITA